LANCKFHKPTRKKLCRGDLNKKIRIQTRDLDESDYDSSQPVEQFATVFTRRSTLETVTGILSGGKKFSGVSIDERTTHIFYVLYSSALEVIESSNYFILFREKRFRVVSVTNINEDNQFLAIQVTDRGEDSLEATKA